MKLLKSFCLSLLIILIIFCNLSCGKKLTDEEKAIRRCMDFLPYNCVYPLHFRDYVKEHKSSNISIETLCDEYIISDTKELYEDLYRDSPLKFEQISDLNVERGQYQKSITLENGNVLIIGGNKKGKDLVEVFSPSKNAFLTVSNQDSLKLNFK